MAEITVATFFPVMLAVIVYAAAFYFKNNPLEKFDWFKILGTVIVGIGVGVVYAITGVNVSQESLEIQLVAYAGTIAIVEGVLKAIWVRFAIVTEFFPVNTELIRKMSEESRHWLVFDLRETVGIGVLKCVDIAEEKSTIRYAIKAVNDIFLIECGQLVGHKKYLLGKFYLSGAVEWKPITMECLEACRKKGRIPDWEYLY